MDPLELEEKLSNLLRKSIEIHSLYPKCPTLYYLQKEDIDFVKKEIDTPATDLDKRLDALIKLFVAFFVDAMPAQIRENLKKSPVMYKKDDECQDMLIMLAGMLHEAKIIIKEDADNLLPYLIAYKDYLGDNSQKEVPDNGLDEFFSAQIDATLQQVLHY
jgi:hypothetical protein